MKKSNIVLIGMPGAGKSTVGVLLAKALKMPFADTDLLLQQQQSLHLQEIINNSGLDSFLRLEEKLVTGLNLENHVIATGGSVIYSEPAILHLKKKGLLIYLHLKYYQIERRINNITTRGIAMQQDQTLSDLYRERVPLYKKHAEITIDCSRKHIESIVAEIIEKVKNFNRI